MKIKSTFLLLLGISSTLASAQNVIVVMNDGTTHKFNADYLKEICFKDAPAEVPVINLPEVSLNVFSGGNVTVNLSNEAGDQFELDLYGPKTEPWLHAGIYTLASTNDPFTFDPSYSSVTHGGAKSVITGGTVEVLLDDHLYTIIADLTLDSGEEVKGKFEGQLPSYTQWLDVAMSAASYLPVEQPAGNFYIKLNDSAWAYEMAIVLVASPDATELPAGLYVYDGVDMPMTISAKSYVDTFSPNANLRLMEGSTTEVVREGNVYTLNMHLNLSDGRVANFKYEGEISGKPSFEPPTEEKVTFEIIDVNPYGGGNTGITFANPNGLEVLLDCYGSASTPYFETGVYLVGGVEGLFIDTDLSYTYVLNPAGEKLGITGGTMTVTREGAVYTMVCDFTLSDGSKFESTYTGELNKFSAELKLAMSAASYNSNEMEKGEFYVKFNDADWKCEMALDFFADAAATVLPAGTYTYSAEEGVAGTFGPSSYVDIFSPYTTNRMTEGSEVTVAESDGTYVITMHLIFTDGRIADFNFTGEISGTPSFKQ